MDESQEKVTLDKQKEKEVTPLNCFFASLVSGGIGFAVYSLMSSIVSTYADKPVISNNALSIRIATAVRTLVIGIAALGAGVFAIVAVGLFLLGIQLTIKSVTNKASSEG